MHFNIYLDDETGKRISSVAEKAGESRNALIRRAVGEWLDRHGRADWPEAVRNFQGVADAPAFEEHRATLGPPAADPMA